MIAVIFEAIPADGQLDNYLAMAARLKPELAKIEGFISVERFQSLSTQEKVLSLSFWEDEKAVQAWRNIEMHRDAQSIGRKSVFADYHLRIGQIIRDYGMFDRAEAPMDSRKAND
jgi:heme-degrading monooxygenase HmoA